MNFKIIFLLGFFFLFLTVSASAQKENNNWYFGGYAGITFNSGKPVALPPSKMWANEGTISVSDSLGNLLFYSNGETVWNRKHVPMQNGTGLMGHNSATQAVLAVPKPGSRTIYYIFTVDAHENNYINGLRYSILDIGLAGGLGAITNTKNVLLEAPVTEKLIAIRHANDVDFWIVAHKLNSSEFVVYKLTEAGVETSVVVSNIGSLHKSRCMGQLKANKHGSKLALMKFNSAKLELFDFDAATGKVLNAQFSDSLFYKPYGVEFSEDGTKLYGSGIEPVGFIQFNLDHPAGLGSYIPIPTGKYSFSGLQLGPDNKIYCTEWSWHDLGVINNPNALGTASNFIKPGVSLNNEWGFGGFPNMIFTTKRKNLELGRDTTLCPGEKIIIGERPIAGMNYEWQDGSTQSTMEVSKPGRYTLKKSNEYFAVQDEINVYYKDCPLFIPNIITPNQDNVNDTFVLKNLFSTDFELQIYNRWGVQVYKTESYKNDWNAEDVSAGVYYYLLRNNKSGQTYKGWLEVVK